MTAKNAHVPPPMADGVYWVSTPWFTAGFVVRGGKVVTCAPILRKRIAHWARIAQRITL